MSLRQRLRRPFAALLIVAAAAMLPGPAAAEEPPPPVWSDVQTGLAIGGYDPLTYFVDGEPKPGSREHEGSWAGVTWRFVNEGNRAAFLEAPQVYAPRFGGYSAPGIAKGAAVRGNPLIWAISGDRLYLFYSDVHKLLWEQDRTGVTTAAEARWPEVMRTLAR